MEGLNYIDFCWKSWRLALDVYGPEGNKAYLLCNIHIHRFDCCLIFFSAVSLNCSVIK